MYPPRIVIPSAAASVAFIISIILILCTRHPTCPPQPHDDIMVRISENVSMTVKLRFPLPRANIESLEITDHDSILLLDDMCYIYEKGTDIRNQLTKSDFHALQQSIVFSPRDCD